MQIKKRAHLTIYIDTWYYPFSQPFTLIRLHIVENHYARFLIHKPTLVPIESVVTKLRAR